MATHPPFTRKLKIKLGGQIVHQSTGYCTEKTPSGDTQQTSSAGTVDVESPTSRALSILGQMGSGRLPQGQRIMTPLPTDFAHLSQRFTAKQQQRAQATDIEARAASAAPSRPLSAGLKGKLEKAEARLKGPDAGTKGKAKQAQAPSKPGGSGARDNSEKAAGATKPAAKSKADKAEGASWPIDGGAKGNSDRPKGLPQPSSSEMRASGQSKEVPSRLNGVAKATKDDQANGHTNGRTNGQASGKGKDEKAEGATTNGKKRPAWGAPLPPAKAAKVSEARTFKRLKKSASPPEAEVVDKSVPSKQSLPAQPQQASPLEDSTPPEPMVDVPAKAVVAPARTVESSRATALTAKAAPVDSSAAPLPPLPAAASGPKEASAQVSTAASVTVGPSTSKPAAAAAAADAQRTGTKPSSVPQVQAEASARPSHPSLHPPVDPPPLSSAKPAAQDPSPTPGQTPADPPLVWLKPNAPAVPAVDPETAQSGALPSAYANLPEKATAPLGKSRSMQPRSVAVGAGKIPLKVIRPQIPGMTKAPSPCIAGASTLIGEARRHLEASMASTPQAGATAQHAQHSMPADSQPPSSSSAGAAAGKPVATGSGPRDAARGQNAAALAMQTDQPSSVALGKRSDSTHPTPSTAAPGQPQDGPTPPATSDRLQTEASTVSKGRPDRTGAAPMGSSPLSIGRADGSGARLMGSMSGKRESPKGEEAPVPERSQSQAADASRGTSVGKKVYVRARDRRSRSPRRSFSRHSSRRGRSTSTSSSCTSRSRYTSRSRSRSRSLSRHRSRSWRKSSSRRSRTRSPDRNQIRPWGARDRDRARGNTRDRSRDRSYPKDNRGRAVGGRRPERDPLPLQRDAKGSQGDRGRGQKALPRAPDKGRGRERDSGTQQQDVRGKEEYPVNAHGVVVSPENIQRAKERRQVKSVKGGWLAAEDSGLLDTMPHPSTAGVPMPALTPNLPPAVATDATTKGPGQDIPRQKVPQSHAEPKQATAVAPEAAAKALAPAVPTVTPAAVATIVPAAEVPITPAAVCQVPVSGATAAADRPQLQPSSITPAHSDNTMAPISFAKPAVAVEVLHTPVDPAAATAEAAGTTIDTAAAMAKTAVTTAEAAAASTDTAAATAKAAVTTAEAAAAAAASPEATTQDAAADIYSPIRSLPSSATLTGPSVPTLATLPPPQLNPLPPPPQFLYQQPANSPGLAPYATAEQVAAWQQQQAYQGYYGTSYPYTDPSYGYTDPSYGYAQMTQPHPSYGVPTSAPAVVSAAQPLPGNVAPPRPPPLGPMSPPPKRPVIFNQVSGAPSTSQIGPQAGQPAAGLPQGYPGHAPSALAAQPAAATASESMPGAAGPVVNKKIALEEARLRRLNERKPTPINRHKAHDEMEDRQKALDEMEPRNNLSDGEAGPSQLPFRDTSSSDSGRAGQNGARAGPNAPQGRASQPFRRGKAAAEASLNRGSGEQGVRRRLDRPEEVRSGLDRESSRSGDSSGAGPGLKCNMQRAAGPSRLGPGRGDVRPGVPCEREPVNNGRKRRLQSEAAGSGSQGSHHSPRAAAGSPLKKQKTGNLPAQPASTGVGFGDVPPDGITALLAFLSNTKQEDMLKAKPEQLAHQAAQVMGKAEAAERHPKGFKGARGLHYAFQASLLYLHHAAVLQDKRGPSVNIRLLEALKQAIEALELTLRMHASAWEGFCNPLQKTGLMLLLEKLLHSALSMYTAAELPLLCSTRANVKMAMQSKSTVTLGWQPGTASAAFQRVANKGTSSSVPEDTLMEDLQAQATSQDRMIRMAQLTQRISEHMGVVRTLVKSPMHGLKPEREEVVARFSCIDYTMAEKLVDWVFLARKAMLTLYRLAPEFE